MANPAPIPFSAALRRFRQIVESRVSVPETEWAYALPLVGERIFEKNEYLVRAGDTAENFYFIFRGLVRFFYSSDKGKEFNKYFAAEDRFAGSFHSMAAGEPCPFSIQALERTETVVLPNSRLHELFDRHPCWERLGRRNAEDLVLIEVAREKELLLDPLETRYRRFLRDNPGLADRLPQYHIASYLGVTNVALSRLRRKIKRG